MKEVGDDRNLLVQPYPIELTRHAFHQPRHRQRSSRKRLGHRPVVKSISMLIPCILCHYWWSIELRRRNDKLPQKPPQAMRTYRLRRLCYSVLATDWELIGIAYFWEGAFGEDAAMLSVRRNVCYDVAELEQGQPGVTYIKRQVFPQL